MPFKLVSPAFKHLDSIPRRFTADGESISPPLKWSGAPGGTQEYALLCEDPDAPTPKPFVHWLLYGLSANTSKLREGMAQVEEMTAPVLARQGLNTMMQVGYTGPNPPLWDGNHRYVFRLFALDSPLTLPPRAGRDEFLKAIRPHVLAETSIEGVYVKSAHGKAVATAWIAAALIIGAGAWLAYRELKTGESEAQAAAA